MITKDVSRVEGDVSFKEERRKKKREKRGNEGSLNKVKINEKCNPRQLLGKAFSKWLHVFFFFFFFSGPPYPFC